MSFLSKPWLQNCWKKPFTGAFPLSCQRSAKNHPSFKKIGSSVFELVDPIVTSQLDFAKKVKNPIITSKLQRALRWAEGECQVWQ